MKNLFLVFGIACWLNIAVSYVLMTYGFRFDEPGAIRASRFIYLELHYWTYISTTVVLMGIILHRAIKGLRK